MSDMKSHDELRAELITKAAADEDFRQRLVSDPKAAIQEGLGIAIPDALSVAVHEDSATTAHLVLPPAAALTEADLGTVAGGHERLYGNHQHSLSQMAGKG